MKAPFESGTSLGAYRLIKPIGDGGMSRVYDAEQTVLGVHRAVKVFATESSHAEFLRKRFLAEGRTLARLDHPRIVRVHDLLVDPATDTPYFAMDLILDPEGRPRTLEDARRDGIDEDQVAQWFADLAEGIDYIHGMGVVHRDVKLENALIGPDGRAVLADFGISRIFDEGLRRRLSVTLTHVGPNVELLMGTLGYLAPELRGDSPSEATPASDAWALGVAVFRLLTGFWFEDQNRPACLALLDDYDYPWRTIVSRLCAHEPSERIPKEGLKSLADGLSAPSAQPRAEKTAEKPRFGRRAAAAAAIVAGLLASGAAIWLIGREGAKGLECLEGTEVDATSQTSQTSLGPHWRVEPDRLWAKLDNILLFNGIDSLDPAAKAVIEARFTRARTGAGLVPQMDDEAEKRLDAWVEGLPRVSTHRPADVTQRFIVLAEIVRRRAARYVAEDDVERDARRLVALLRRTVRETGRIGFAPTDEWLHETVIRETVADMPHILARFWTGGMSDVEEVTPWLAAMLRADQYLAEAAALAGADDYYYSDLKQHVAHKRQAAQFALEDAETTFPGRHATARLALRVASGDPDEVRKRYAACRTFSADDPRDWMEAATSLLPSTGAPSEAEGSFIAETLASNPEESLLHALAVAGRMRFLAKPAPQDLDFIRKYVESAAFVELPVAWRDELLVDYAATALELEQDDYGVELLKRIDEKVRNEIIGGRKRCKGDTTFYSYSRLWWYPYNFPNRHKKQSK